MADMPLNPLRTGPLRCLRMAAVAGAFIASAPLNNAAATQLIPIRIVPVADADQFDFFPAANFGMGGVSIAIPDSLRDPFRNPAKAVRLGRALYFGAPTFFSVSNHAGSGQTLPIGAMLRSGSTYFGGALAVQEISPARPRTFLFGDGPVILTASSSFLPPSPDAQPNKPRNNRYAYATLGQAIPGARVSVAASAMWSGLQAMEGVDLLFNGSHNVRQSGERLDLRLGVLKEWAGDRAFEAVVLHNRFDMSYDVGYAELYWDPGTRQNRVQTFNQLSADGNRTLSLHVSYEMPLADSAWRIGGVATANRVAHERAPYYQIMGVPRDEGYANAYNFGVGVARSAKASRIAVDAIFEPVWRRARGRADTLTLATAGQFAPGSVTNDSYFKFTNFVFRGGLSHDLELSASESRVRLQAGLQLRGVNYTLERHDFLLSTFRSSKHSWREWTHAWGASFVFPRFEFGYQLRLASGMGRIGVAPDNRNDVVIGGGSFPTTGEPFPGGGLPAPTSITLHPVRVATHQITFTVPVR